MESAELYASNIQAAQEAKVPAVNKITTAPWGPCFGCGGDYLRRECKHKDAVCSSCGRSGHLSRVCRASDRARPSIVPARRKNYARSKTPRSTYVFKDKEDGTSSGANSSEEIQA
ncbi:uncharacterized protein LOC123513205 [Portunus trituberculatus]|uniref:uncharacterized protein LOC123513205 n=1 Tax=Portunus trituberculatus TaxID=210409 RepID=UPI001E1CBE86|nr:uncharacterized protein LOC123513205 [Portunus trituberculatus]